MKKFCFIDWIALILVIIGGLNWGLIGLFNFNLVALIFGETTILTRIIYIVVGLASIYTIYFLAKKAKSCRTE